MRARVIGLLVSVFVLGVLVYVAGCGNKDDGFKLGSNPCDLALPEPANCWQCVKGQCPDVQATCKGGVCAQLWICVGDAIIKEDGVALAACFVNPPPACAECVNVSNACYDTTCRKTCCSN